MPRNRTNRPGLPPPLPQQSPEPTWTPVAPQHPGPAVGAETTGAWAEATGPATWAGDGGGAGGFAPALIADASSIETRFTGVILHRSDSWRHGSRFRATPGTGR